MSHFFDKLGVADFAVICVYLVGILGIGVWASRRVKTSRAYFTGDGRMNFVVVGLSLLATYLSAMTMMALSGVAFGKDDLTWTVQLPFLILTAFVVTRFMLPRYRSAGVVSVYEYLERRIHVSTRVLASISFIAFSVARMGIVLYVPALALHTVTGIDTWLIILVMGAVITIYTVLGGIEAVIYTDAIQVALFAVTAVLTVIFIFVRLGDADFLAVAREGGNKLRCYIPGADIKKMTTIWLILQTIFETIRIYGTQQDMTQRYVTTKSTRKASLSVWIGILGYIPLGFAFYFIGIALFVFYYVNVDPEIATMRNDAVYAHFVITQLPPGLGGLMLAGMLAAAMSSIDSLMNSCSTVCIEDFYKRFGKALRSETDYLSIARRLTFLWGAAATFMALTFIGVEYIQWAWTKVMGISTNGILGLMVLAFLPLKINRWAAIIGFVACYVSLALMWLAGVNALLWPVIGNIVCFGVALLVNAFIGPDVKNMEQTF